MVVVTWSSFWICVTVGSSMLAWDAELSKNSKATVAGLILNSSMDTDSSIRSEPTFTPRASLSPVDDGNGDVAADVDVKMRCSSDFDGAVWLMIRKLPSSVSTMLFKSCGFWKAKMSELWIRQFTGKYKFVLKYKVLQSCQNKPRQDKLAFPKKSVMEARDQSAGYFSHVAALMPPKTVLGIKPTKGHHKASDWGHNCPGFETDWQNQLLHINKFHPFLCKLVAFPGLDASKMIFYLHVLGSAKKTICAGKNQPNLFGTQILLLPKINL